MCDFVVRAFVNCFDYDGLIVDVSVFLEFLFY